MAKKVFVSGCYDMLHSGHVAFFEQAAKYGDLYVGIGSDKTVWGLKGRRTVNNDAERLYMVKSVRYVKDAWINSGSGIMDFEKEVLALKPDIFFVNSDGFTPEKKLFCAKHGIQLIVGKRIPSHGLSARSTTAIRAECRIPYRVELCGGWMDQPFLNHIVPGPVLTISVYPDYEFNDRSGMATSSRRKAVELWQTDIPAGDPELLAKLLFAFENPPGTRQISGSQDQLGILMPGLNKLNYDNGYWPVSIDTVTDPDILRFVESKLWLIQLPQRPAGFDVLADTRVSESAVRNLARSAELAWQAILAKNTVAWAENTRRCFEAQLEMFPHTASPDVMRMIDAYRSRADGWKLSGAGGGGYLILISDREIPDSIKIQIRS